MLVLLSGLGDFTSKERQTTKTEMLEITRASTKLIAKKITPVFNFQAGDNTAAIVLVLINYQVGISFWTISKQMFYYKN